MSFVDSPTPNTPSVGQPQVFSRRRMVQALAVAPLAALAAEGRPANRPVGAGSARGVALVTGSSRGIGAAMAQRLAAEGYHVTVNYLQSADRAAEVVRKIEAAGGRAIAVRADVSVAAEVLQLFDETERAFGGIDVVINNAGIMRLAPFSAMTDSDFTRLIDVNLRGGFQVLREAARRVRDHGRIISLSSSITKLRTATYGPYAATKMALEIFSSCLAKELRGRQISVNAVAPGVVATSLFLDVPGRTEQEVAQFAARTPHGRIGEPEDIAAVVAGLVRGDAAWINGETVFANGGLV